ncbi:melanopsin [Brachionus plicatilis]|uniref:Melanopsin n=1 Tax=Brachionus plicatilis TaxID=10195 RepID=A0A3M7SJR7_BRAPC|nr:melanopsin [Brachionus plicatilis]
MISHNESLSKFGQLSPIECYKLNIVSLFCIILFICSFSFNSILLWVFYMSKELRSPLNIIMIALTILNLTGTITELPTVIVTNYTCRWIFGKLMCTVSAFIMYFIGCSSIYLLTAISFERWYVIVEPFKQRHFTFRVTIGIIAGCCLLSFVYCALPLFGWSHYSLELSLVTCSVEWHEKSFNVVSYNFFMFSFVYLIPLIILVYTNIKLIKSLNRFLKISKQNFLAKKRIMKERKLTISILVIIAGFMISWTPYAIVSLISSFFSDYIHITPFMALIPTIFAKTSLVWPSVLYVFSNNQVQLVLSKKFKSYKVKKTISECKNFSGPILFLNMNKETVQISKEEKRKSMSICLDSEPSPYSSTSLTTNLKKYLCIDLLNF